MSRDALLVWHGKEYVLRYEFSVIRRIRSVGVNVPNIFRALGADPSAGVDYLDDIATAIAFLLTEAGCPVTGEEVFRDCLSDERKMREVFALFRWLLDEHYATSPNAPGPKEEPRAQAAGTTRRKKRTT